MAIARFLWDLVRVLFAAILGLCLAFALGGGAAAIARLFQ